MSRSWTYLRPTVLVRLCSRRLTHRICSKAATFSHPTKPQSEPTWEFVHTASPRQEGYRAAFAFGEQPVAQLENLVGWAATGRQPHPAHGRSGPTCQTRHTYGKDYSKHAKETDQHRVIHGKGWLDANQGKQKGATQTHHRFSRGNEALASPGDGLSIPKGSHFRL